MKKILRSFVLAGLAFCAMEASAQTDAQFSHYMFNYLYLNPAYAGSEGVIKAQALHRTQWYGNTGPDGGMSPQTQVISVQGPLLRNKMGLGLVVVNDRIGPRNTLDAQLSAAYHMPLAGGVLSLGLRGGVYTQSLNWNRLNWQDVRDPLYKTGVDQVSQFDMSAGAWYRKGRVFLGASSTHLMRPTFDFGGQGAENRLSRHYYLTGGYNLPLNNFWTLTPTFLIKNGTGNLAYTQIEVSAVAYYLNKLFAGVSYRQEEAVSALFGISFLKNNALRFSYALDLTVPENEVKAPTSHEVMLAYTLPADIRPPKPIIRTPRFVK